MVWKRGGSGSGAGYGSEINNFGSGFSNWKSGILDPDPDLDPGSGSFGELGMVKKMVNFGSYEDTNGMKSWTF